MDNARLSGFPHLSWLPLRLTYSSVDGTVAYPFHHTTHLIHKACKGRHRVRWISGGREETWEADEHTVHFSPADGEHVTALTSAATEYAGTVVCIPETHLRTMTDAEGLKPGSSLRRICSQDDEVLVSCMSRLTSPTTSDGDDEELRKDEAARRLVLRLQELSGAGTPDWHDDASVFERRALRSLVSHIDEHLRIAPSLSELALLVGMSPSHFARKFRQTTGLSLQRFINRRRILRSLELLKTDSSLASIALDLGFSSQSHLSRLFSGLTGTTPAKYRKQVRRVAG